MVRNHLKRIAAPQTWNIKRKVHVFITKPQPGAHSKKYCSSMNTLFKEMIGLATTRKEVKRILHDQEVFVDAKRRYDDKYNVGLMDVVSIPKLNQHYRITLNKKGKLVAISIPEKEKTLKLTQIKQKTVIKTGKMQLGMSDGRAVLIDAKKDYKVGDSLLIELPLQTIKEHYPYKEGASVLVISGKHAGDQGVIEKIEKGDVMIKTAQSTYPTRKTHVFVTGTTKPSITCSE